MAEQEEQRRLDVNWAQLIGGALAAVTSAVLLSTVGVAGTLIGAALGSVAVTLGSSVYSYYLEASHERMAAVRATAFSKALSARQRHGEPSDTLVSDEGPDTETTAVPIDRAEQEEADRRDADEARAEAEREATAEIAAVRRTSWRDAIGRLRWKHVAAVSLAVFALAVGTILAFEVLAGKPVSSFTGGTGSEGPRTSIPFGRDTRDRDQIGYIEATRAIFGRSYAAAPDVLVEELAADEAIAAADTLLLAVPNTLGVEYNVHVIESILKHVAPGLGWR